MLSTEPVSNGDCRPRRSTVIYKIINLAYDEILVGSRFARHRNIRQCRWPRWYNRSGYLWSSRHNNLCLTSLSACPNGIPILYSLYYRFYIVKVVDERRDISLWTVSVLHLGEIVLIRIRGSGRELSSLGLLMPTLLWVGGRRLSHNAALWL